MHTAYTGTRPRTSEYAPSSGIATTYPARNPVTIGVACSKCSMVRPTSPAIAGSNVTTT